MLQTSAMGTMELSSAHLPVLCCAVLCCAVLCCAVLCCAVLCCAVLCCAVLCCALPSWAIPLLYNFCTAQSNVCISSNTRHTFNEHVSKCVIFCACHIAGMTCTASSITMVACRRDTTLLPVVWLCPNQRRTGTLSTMRTSTGCLRRA